VDVPPREFFVPSFKWSHHNEVYVPELDAEHKALFRIADEVSRAMKAGAMLGSVQPLLRDLVRHTRLHFSHEERRMRAERYPSYAWHKGQHDTVRARVAELQRSTRRGDREAVLPAMEFLAGWLQNHTSVTDRMMAAYLRNRTR